MDTSKILVKFNSPRPDRKAKKWSKCWKDWRGCKKARQYNVIVFAA